MRLLSINIPTYTSRDYKIMLVMLPFAGLFNYYLFDLRYFTEIRVFILATLVTSVILILFFLWCGAIAVSFRERFPRETESTKRLVLSIALFILMSAVLLSLMLRGYELFGFLGYTFSEQHFTRTFFCLAVLNVFLTFLFEGIARFENYKATFIETEQLKKEYMKSQLLGLKSQVNPHFLFNSLNTLSCLIHDDAEKAESFLDEMSKVYRYLLRNNEEQLVTLETELSYLQSYYHLLKSRHGDGLELEVNVPQDRLHHTIPPLTLQMIFENAVEQNTMTKEKPLMVSVSVAEEGWLLVTNTIQPKLGCCDEGESTALENVGNKLRLLSGQEMTITADGEERLIRLPLISQKELSAV